MALWVGVSWVMAKLSVGATTSFMAGWYGTVSVSAGIMALVVILLPQTKH